MPPRLLKLYNTLLKDIYISYLNLFFNVLRFILIRHLQVRIYFPKTFYF